MGVYHHPNPPNHKYPLMVKGFYMEREHTIRAADVEIIKLTARVEELDKDVQKLRADFDSHLLIEDARFKQLSMTLMDIQTKIDKLLLEVKEPIESYNKAKYGVSGIKWIYDLTKWLAPLLFGLWLGNGVLTGGIYAKDLAPKPEVQKIEKSETYNENSVSKVEKK